MSARTLLNTLYVQTQGGYLRLDHETVVLEVERSQVAQVPLHHLRGIALFGDVLISPFLLARCAQDGRAVTWFTGRGRFCGRLAGRTAGNVFLRQAQYRAAQDEVAAALLARSFVKGKIRAAVSVLGRANRDYPDVYLERARDRLHQLKRTLDSQTELDKMRGIEGRAARVYYAAFPKLIRVPSLPFLSRTKRPPRDPVNAVLSFTYALLTQDCVSALEGVGLDPQVGFLHAVRPGRPSLALDLMEEFRNGFADRLVLTLLNRQQLQTGDFDRRPGGAVLLNEQGRKTLLTAYGRRCQEEIHHPLFKESVAVGLLPHIQARILARHIRGDVDEYVGYTWR